MSLNPCAAPARCGLAAERSLSMKVEATVEWVRDMGYGGDSDTVAVKPSGLVSRLGETGIFTFE